VTEVSDIQSGGRVEMRREFAAPSAELFPVRYDVRLVTTSGVWRASVTLHSATDLEWAKSDDFAPPAWLFEFSTHLLRTVARTAVRDPASGFPRRLTRWRTDSEAR
jgi:hypothetical protein